MFLIYGKAKALINDSLRGTPDDQHHILFSASSSILDGNHCLLIQLERNVLYGNSLQLFIHFLYHQLDFKYHVVCRSFVDCRIESS